MAGACDPAPHEVDLEIGDAKSGGLGGSTPPGQGAHARNDLGKREGLDQVVVGAAVESGQAIVECVARRKDEHGRMDTAAAKGAKDLKAVASGQHEIEQNHVEGFRAQTEERVLSG